MIYAYLPRDENGKPARRGRNQKEMCPWICVQILGDKLQSFLYNYRGRKDAPHKPKPSWFDNCDDVTVVESFEELQRIAWRAIDSGEVVSCRGFPIERPEAEPKKESPHLRLIKNDDPI